MSEAKEGERVKIHYTGRREDGTIFDTSKEDVPVEFIIGEGGIISGIEKGVIGMAVGDQKTITVPPKDGFGPTKKELIKVVRKSDFPKNLTPTIGLQVQLRKPDGDIIDANVVDIEENSVFLNANHPLAGQTLKLDVELIEIMNLNK